jgi:hypothetical protein
VLPVLAALLAAPLVSTLASPARAQSSLPRQFIECGNIRRLSDNYALDLRIRLTFERAGRSYARFENAGRGWQLIGRRDYVARTANRIVLADNPYYTSYIERLTGDYYHIDLTGTGLSLWGRCARTGGLHPNF